MASKLRAWYFKIRYQGEAVIYTRKSAIEKEIVIYLNNNHDWDQNSLRRGELYIVDPEIETEL